MFGANGLGLGLLACRRWSPRSLFVGGEQGFWYDPSDLTTMFQDAAGTTPAAIDAPVGLIRDKSGKGNHATQATADSRPILRLAGGLYYLEFDGVDDFLATSPIDFSGGDRISVFAGLRKTSDAEIGSVVGLTSNPPGNSGTFEMFAPQSTVNVGYSFRSRGSASSTPAVTAIAAPHSAILTGLGVISGDTAILRVNGSPLSAATDQGSGNLNNAAVYIGRRGGTTLPFNGRLYGLIVRAGLSSGAMLALPERYLARKAGVAPFAV